MRERQSQQRKKDRIKTLLIACKENEAQFVIRALQVRGEKVGVGEGGRGGTGW